MRKIVINGANGYVASHFIQKLLDRNYKVDTFVRDGKKILAADRMKAVLYEINNDNNRKDDHLKVYNYSLLEEDYLLPHNHLEQIFNGKIDFFHFAACLKYHLKDRDEIFNTNVNGLENSIKTFLKYSGPASRFFFISTVYSCGYFPELFEEKFYDNESIERFRNYYEQSKRIAENIVRQYTERKGLNGYVIRLSQVAGNNISGVTVTEYGVFDFVKRVQKFSGRYPNSTIRIRANPNATQNLISIDNVVNYLMKATCTPQLPAIIHFAGKNPVKNDQIIKCICEHLPITLIQDNTLEKKNMNAKERILALGMSFTGGYTNTDLHISTRNLDKYFSPDGNEVNEESLRKMIRYFIKNHNE